MFSRVAFVLWVLVSGISLNTAACHNQFFTSHWSQVLPCRGMWLQCFPFSPLLICCTCSWITVSVTCSPAFPHICSNCLQECRHSQVLPHYPIQNRMVLRNPPISSLTSTPFLYNDIATTINSIPFHIENIKWNCFQERSFSSHFFWITTYNPRLQLITPLPIRWENLFWEVKCKWVMEWCDTSGRKVAR